MESCQNIKDSRILTNLYDSWLTSTHIENQYRDYSFFHPSEIGYCIRKSVLMQKKQDGEFYVMPRLQRVFENGHGTHHRYQKHFGEMGILYGIWKCLNCHRLIGEESLIGVLKPIDCPFCHNPKRYTVYDDQGNIKAGPFSVFDYKEIDVEDQELCIKGKTDGIILVNGDLYVMDVKTCSQAAFGDVTSRNAPMESHIYQINTYMYILKVKRGILLYENRNDLNIKEFHLTLDNKVICNVLRNILEAKKAEENGTIPAIPSSLNANCWSCAGYPNCPPCPFFGFCYPAEAEMAKIQEEKYKKFILTKKLI